MSEPHNILSLDVGDKKIGVARASAVARLPEPLAMAHNDDGLIDRLRAIVDEYMIDTLVVGLPRNMNGEETEQTRKVRTFAHHVADTLKLPLVMQDETLSTDRANAYRQRTGSAADEDSLAACVILEDYLDTLQSPSGTMDTDV